MSVQIIRGKDGQYYIRLISMANHEPLNVSQGYATHWNAKRAARKVFPEKIKVDANGKRFE